MLRALFVDASGDLLVEEADDLRGEMAGVARAHRADRDRRDRDAGQASARWRAASSKPASGVAASGTPDHRQGRERGEHAGKVRRGSRAGDEHPEPALGRGERVGADHVARAVRRHDADLPADPVLVKHLAARVHDGQVGLAADDDPDPQRAAHARAPAVTGRPMSVRACIPSKCTRPRLAYARALAAPMPSPTAVTHSTRPPAVRRVPSASRRVPAWKQSTSPSSAVDAGDRVAAPRRRPGSRPHAATTPTAAPGGAARDPGRDLSARARGEQLDAPARQAAGSTTCASGSPKRALNSSTRIPRSVSIRPGVQTSDEGRPALAQRVDAGLEHRSRHLVERARPARCRVAARWRPCRRYSGRGRRRRCACGRGRERACAPRVPSLNPNTLTSGPLSSSSTTTWLPASPNRLVARHSSSARSASSTLSQTITPLPSASPSAFTTHAPARSRDERAHALRSVRAAG